jgi:uncharacterized protein YjdB
MLTTKRLVVVVALVTAACGSHKELSSTLLVQIQVTPPAPRVAAGLSQQLAATAIYENGRRQDVTDQVAWSSSEVTVAAVDASGLVTAATAGSTVVVASLEGKTASATLQVSDAILVSLELAPSQLQVPLGVALSALVRGTFSDGSLVDLTSQVSWGAPGGGLEVVMPGQFRASAKGLASLTASFQEREATADVLVTDAVATALQLGSARNLAALPKGTLARIVAIASFTDGTALDVTADVTWSSDARAVAAVEGALVRAIGVGVARLVGSYQGRSSALDVTVTEAEVVALSVLPPLATAPAGDFVELSAIATYTDGSSGDVTDQVTWSSLDPVAVQLSNRLNEHGHAYGLIRGSQTVVTAQLPCASLSATTLVQVGAPSVRGFRIDQALSVASRTAIAGTDLQLSATATYTDGTTANASALLRWESFSPGVAVADPLTPGLIHTLAPGSATIVVTFPDHPLIWMSAVVFVR